MATPTLVTFPDGRVVVNPEAMYRQPFHLLTNQPDNAVSVPALQQSGPMPLTINSRGPMTVHKFGCERTGTCALNFRLADGTGSHYIQNTPIHVDTLFGDGLQPYWLPTPLYVAEGAMLFVEIIDLSGSANSVRLDLMGQQYLRPQSDAGGQTQRNRMARRQYVESPYFYGFDTGPVTLVGGSTGQGLITVGSEFHFLITQISGVSTGRFTLDIVEESMGESLINAPQARHYQVQDPLIVGTNHWPVKLVEPWFIRSGSKLVVDMTDTSQTTNVVWLTLGGVALRPSEARQTQ